MSRKAKAGKLAAAIFAEMESLRSRITELEHNLQWSVGDLAGSESRTAFQLQTLETAVQSHGREIARMSDRLSPVETRCGAGPVPGPVPGPAFDLGKMERCLRSAVDTLALYADEKYWRDDRCPLLRNGAAVHALTEIAALRGTSVEELVDSQTELA